MDPIKCDRCNDPIDESDKDAFVTDWSNTHARKEVKPANFVCWECRQCLNESPFAVDVVVRQHPDDPRPNPNPQQAYFEEDD